MTDLGGLWVKMGQYIASRSDMVAPPIVQRLSAMLDSNPPRPLSQIVRTLALELGREGSTRIASIDASPLSTASIAQVHSARLSDGQKVAVKVQHEEVGTVMRQDIAQARVLCRVLALVEPNFDFTSLIEEATSENVKELDFRIEAANLADVGANLKRARVVAEVPSPIEGLFTERLLVMTFSEGMSLKSREALLAAGIDLHLLVGRVCEAWAVQLLRDGIFNADPHAGNLLVRQDEAVGPLPVLLDFGLCKRLSAEARLRFCQLVHALSEQDGDLLLESLLGLGMKLNVQIEPAELLSALMFAFRDSDADVAASRAAHKAKMAREMRRDKVYRKEEERRKREEGSAFQKMTLPPEIVYFFRTIDMLQGLSTRLGVSYPFLKPLATCAQQSLLRHARRQGGAVASPLSPMQPSPATRGTAAAPAAAANTPQRRATRVLSALASTGELLGGQACLIVRGKTLVDTAAGRMGPVDPRPVRADSLFQLFQAGAPLLALLVLQATARGEMSLDTPLSRPWPAFGPSKLAVRQLLAHCSGLGKATPSMAHLRQLLRPEAMAEWLAEQQAPLSGSPTEAEYEGAPWGWAIAGLLRAAGSGGGGAAAGFECGNEWSLQRLCESDVTDPLGLSSELRLTLTEAMSSSRAARHTTSAMLREMGVELSDMLSAAANAGGATATAAAASKPSARAEPAKNGSSSKQLAAADADVADVYIESSQEEGLDWERFQGAQQLQNPATLNSAQLREACVPGVSAHGSARGLASLYAALTSANGLRALRLPSGLLESAAQPASSGTLNGEPVSWGLGLQLGRATGGSGGRTYTVVGHLGLGTVGLAVPECGVALAVTVSQLSSRAAVARRVTDLLLQECGLALQGGFFPV